MALALRLSTIVRLGKGVFAPSHRFLSSSSIRPGTIVPFKLSDIGEGIREVTLKEWFVSPGDKVAQFDEICEVQSDKASVTITSRYDGHVKTLHYKVDETALVGDPLVDIELEEDVPGVTTDNQIRTEAGENLAATTTPNVHLDTARRTSETNIASESSEKALTTPAVRRIAWENKIDLKDVPATGKSGRVLKEDIIAYLEKKSVNNAIRETGTITSVTISGSQTIPLKGYQKHMWKSMTQSLKIISLTRQRHDDTSTHSHPTDLPKIRVGDAKQIVLFERPKGRFVTGCKTIPHFVYSDECDISKLVTYRSEVRDFLKEQGIALTFMPFFIKAVSKALHDFPRLNAWIDENSQTLQMFEQHNISVAMDTPDGLAVPNIKNVQNLTIVQIAKELNRLQELGKKASIPLNDITGGTFSLSNIGVVGGTYTKPVILPPQIVIGAVGKMQKLPRFDASQKVIAADILSVSWAADHRVVDGVTMAKFSNRWKYLVENPSFLIL